MGIRMADSPSTRPILAILLPIIFPTATSILPLTAATKLTRNSGEDVPKATMVSPTMIGDTLRISAIRDEPLTSSDAPT